MDRADGPGRRAERYARFEAGAASSAEAGGYIDLEPIEQHRFRRPAQRERAPGAESRGKPGRGDRIDIRV